MPIYNKLVRDKIPEIMENKGKNFSTRILSESEYLTRINEKMQEELDEYLSAESNEEAVGELADLLELIYTASKAIGSDIHEVENKRDEKAQNRVSLRIEYF